MSDQPRAGVVEGVGVAGTVAGPGDLSDDHAVLGTAHPRRVRLEERPDAAQIQRPPPPPAPATVIARAAPSTLAAPTLRRLARAHRHDDAFLVLVELDAFDDDLLQPEQPRP